jgi:hypothetical protein
MLRGPSLCREFVFLEHSALHAAMDGKLLVIFYVIIVLHLEHKHTTTCISNPLLPPALDWTALGAVAVG